MLDIRNNLMNQILSIRINILQSYVSQYVCQVCIQITLSTLVCLFGFVCVCLFVWVSFGVFFLILHFFHFRVRRKNIIIFNDLKLCLKLCSVITVLLKQESHFKIKSRMITQICLKITIIR